MRIICLYIFVDYFVSCITRIDNCNNELILIGAYCVVLCVCNLLSEKIFHLYIKLTLFCVCMYVYVYVCMCICIKACFYILVCSLFSAYRVTVSVLST